ncbi:hypothetical protein [Paenibacillus humicus]|uniref:hypothetical protein n=1 Tax=Paenibacillus humicus TaxID=412861 RepID=UPI0013E30314|nr:hypothetical protein [Paenibacillus humicus]
MREGAQLTRNNVSAYAALEAGMARVLQTAGDTGDKLREIIDAYFDPEHGIGCTLCRSHIQSRDFSLGNYAYLTDGDEGLESFNVDRDHMSILPLIKRAAGKAGSCFRLFSSP